MALTQISTAGVKDDAVTSGKIPANAVGTSEIAADAVTTAKIAAGNVTETELASNAVTGAKIATGAINNANKIQDSIITGAKIGSGTVAAGNLASNSVTTAKIAAEAITLDKLAHGTSSNNGKFLRANNGADPTFETVSTDLVADTTPQLGGNLDLNSNNIEGTGSVTIAGNVDLTDSGRVKLGTGDDLQIYHNGSGSFIDAYTSNLQIRNDGSEVMAAFNRNGDVELYNDGLKQVETFHGNAGQSGTDFTAGGLKTTRTNSHNSNIGYYCYKDSNLVARLSNHGSGPEGMLQLYNQGVAKITMNGTNGTIKLHGTSSHIQFGDTNAAAHQLDDYEEGTWTPTFVSTGASFTYNHQYGYYQKVGNTVHVSFYITLGNGSPLSGTTSNNLNIAVPFQATNATRYEAACCFSMIYKFNLNGGSQDILLTGRLYSGESKINLLAQFDDAAGYAYPAIKADQAGCGLAGSITYRVHE